MSIKLDAKIRGKGALNQLRRAGLVPGVVYGRGSENMNIAVSRIALENTLKISGENTLLDLNVDGNPSTGAGAGKSKHVLIHDIQMDPVKDFPTHVDFLEVKLDQKIKAEILLVFTGDSLAVKELGGVLVKSVNHVEVEAFPQNLPHNIKVDISGLKTFEDHIIVADIKTGPDVKVLTQDGIVVATVVPPRSEAELEALKTEVVEDITKVEGVVKEEPLVETDSKGAQKEEVKTETKFEAKK